MGRCKCTNKDKPVSVRDYTRVRNGEVEHVRTHCRSLPGWKALIRRLMGRG